MHPAYSSCGLIAGQDVVAKKIVVFTNYHFNLGIN